MTVLFPFDRLQRPRPWAVPSGGAVTDSLFQEIDLRTGLVRRSGTASTTCRSAEL